MFLGLLYLPTYRRYRRLCEPGRARHNSIRYLSLSPAPTSSTLARLIWCREYPPTNRTSMGRSSLRANSSITGQRRCIQTGTGEREPCWPALRARTYKLVKRQRPSGAPSYCFLEYVFRFHTAASTRRWKQVPQKNSTAFPLSTGGQPSHDLPGRFSLSFPEPVAARGALPRDRQETDR
jgi:hypothetical protein